MMGFDISDGMIDVPAVQYMRPDGLLVDVTAPIPIECKAAYDEMTERGCRLAGEVLTTGHVSLTIEHDEGDFAIEVCPNGPEVREATRRLFSRWSAAEFDRWLAHVLGGEAS